MWEDKIFITFSCLSEKSKRASQVATNLRTSSSTSSSSTTTTEIENKTNIHNRKCRETKIDGLTSLKGICICS